MLLQALIEVIVGGRDDRLDGNVEVGGSIPLALAGHRGAPSFPSKTASLGSATGTRRNPRAIVEALTPKWPAILVY